MFSMNLIVFIVSCAAFLPAVDLNRRRLIHAHYEMSPPMEKEGGRFQSVPLTIATSLARPFAGPLSSTRALLKT